MLAKENRITEGNDFLRILRKGRKTSTTHFLVASTPNTVGVLRAGFLVNKKVGNAVTRNSVRRKLQALVQETLVDSGRISKDVVVRANPGAADLSWDEIRGELLKALKRV